MTHLAHPLVTGVEDQIGEGLIQPSLGKGVERFVE
jgi:hypothetical protein